MSLLLSRLPRTHSLEGPEKSFAQFQTNLQNNLFQLLRFLVPGFLILLTIYSHANGLPLCDTLNKNFHFIGALALLAVPTPWPRLQNIIFLFIIWLIEISTLSDILTSFDQAFFIGYTIGIIEVILTLGIKNSCFRIFTQTFFIFSKVFNFSQFVEKFSAIIMVLGGLSLISALFFIYCNSLDRKNYQGLSDSRQKLSKLQTILTDDFPMSVIIISSDLKRTLYTNHHFAQNLCQESQLLSGNEPIETLFQKITLEFDDTNRQIDFDLKRISLFTFITQTMNAHPRFNNRDVFNLYSLYQEEGAAQHHYEIKLRKMLWEDTSAYTIIFNDVSDKQKSTALQDADEQRDRVIATITHELKTPINGILGLLDIVECRSKDPISKTYLEHCKNCSKLLLYLVNSIMDLSQLRQNNLQVDKTVFSLDELLNETQSLYIFISEHRGLQFIVEKSPEVPDYIYTDKHRLISVLVQLLGNAMKFTFKGFVKLKVEMCKENQKKLTFIVEDSGIGIKEEDKIKLVNMFGQITEKDKNINHHGAGLGITIANELVGVLNGQRYKQEQIEYESEFGRGSVFRFRINFMRDSFPENEADPFAEHIDEQGTSPLNLPMKRVERRVLSNRPNLNVSSRGNSFEIDPSIIIPNRRNALIVDDNPFNLVVASFVVAKLGFQSFTAANGGEAINMLQQSVESGQHYYFILMDIQMPIMDGIQATKAINQMIQKGELYTVPVIALTAKKIDSNEKRVYKECGMLEALSKPLIEQELKDVLDNLEGEYC